MQLRFLYAKRLILLMLPLLVSMGLVAQSRYKTGDVALHYLTLQLGGGESNTLVETDRCEMKNLGGADAQFAFSYEVRKQSFFFNVGASAHYTYTGQSSEEGFVDTYDALSIHNKPHTYRYHYTEYEERQHTLLVGMPIQFGWYVIPEFFIAVGARAEYPLLNMYETQSLLMTDGVFPQFFEPFQDNAVYGFYPTAPIAKTGNFSVLPTISPTLELGTRFALSKKVDLRLGLYAEYAIPLLQERNAPLTDYSRVDQNPLTHNQDNLWAMLKLNSILDHSDQTRDYYRLSVGVRMTVLFNLKSKIPCVTCSDDSGIPYNVPRRKRSEPTTRIHRW